MASSLISRAWLVVAGLWATNAHAHMTGTGTRSSSIPTQTVAAGEYGSDQVKLASEEFDDFIKSQMDEWHVPGVAISMIEDNSTWAKGYGYGTLDSDPVTPATLFYCGSMTKSFTAAALSLLVDEPDKYSGIKWTSTISSLLREEFVLSDAWATDHITVADALSHRTGYPRHDYAGPFGNSSVEMIKALQYLPMSEEPRVKWQYSNMMYGVLGYLVEVLSHTGLADFFRDRLWLPMGMKHTHLRTEDALNDENPLAHSYYYNNDTDSYGVFPWNDENNVAAAGMAISSVLDWSRYLRHMIQEAGPISKAGHEALKSPWMVSEQDKRIYAATEYYGFGWASNVIENKAVWYHSGRVSGMMSYMAFVPSEKFAFSVMMNIESVPALEIIFSQILLRRFGVPRSKQTDLREFWQNFTMESNDRLHNCSARLYPTTSSRVLPLSADLASFVGSYHDPGYGFANITLRCEDDWFSPKDSPAALSMTKNGCRLAINRTNLFGKLTSLQLEHVSGDYWVAWLFTDEYKSVTRPSDCYRAQFTVGPDGTPISLGLDIRMEGEEIPLTWFKRS